MLLLVVLVGGTACAESPSRSSAASPPWLVDTDPAQQLVTAVAQVPALAGYEVLTSQGQPSPSTEASGAAARDLSSARVTLALSACRNLEIGTGPSLLATRYDPPGVRQTLYNPGKPVAFLLIGDRVFSVEVRPRSTCFEAEAPPFTADELMTVAESIATEYGFSP